VCSFFPADRGHIACNLRCCLRSTAGLGSNSLGSGLVTASLVTLIAAGEVHSLLRAIMVSAAPISIAGRPMPIYRSGILEYFACAWLDLKSLHFLGGRHLGSVDCWLCQIFTRSLGTTLPSFRVLRVTRCGFSPPESCM
jgi:hypothetical protein